MLLRPARATYCHLSRHPAYEHVGIYALLLLGFIEAIANWPWNLELLDVLMAHPALFALNVTAWEFAAWALLACSVLGMLRRGWPDRLAGAVAFARGQIIFGWYMGYEDGLFMGLYHQVSYLLVEAPFRAVLSLANGVEAFAVPLAALYIGLVWLVLRVAFALTRDHANEFAARKLERWNLGYLAGKPAPHAGS